MQKEMASIPLKTENGGAKHYLEMESDDVPAVPDGYFAFSAAV